jgi:hypothetical protein
VRSLQHAGSVCAHIAEHVPAVRLLGAANALYADFGLAREFTEATLYESHLISPKTSNRTSSILSIAKRFTRWSSTV